MPAIARLAGKRVRRSECLLNNETVSKAWRTSEGKLVEIGELPEGGNIDGLEEHDGRLIVASQVDQAIWSWRDGEAVKLFDTPGRPADIGIDSRRGRIAVPYIALDRVELWALPRKE